MNPDESRRRFLQTFSALPLLAGFGFSLTPETAAAAIRYGSGRAFDFNWLKTEAKRLGQLPYRDDKPPAPDLLDKLDFDAMQKIRYNAKNQLWGDAKQPQGVRFFHMHRFARLPVQINLVENGVAKEIEYHSSLFEYGGLPLAKKLPDDLGFAGFRVLNPGKESDWIAFQGVSYFRTSGEQDQYGLSARGLSIDSGLDPEEFPRFSEFWLERTSDPQVIYIYALLESPSVTGAYRFKCVNAKSITMEVECQLHFRKATQRLGIAPLTSMYWYSEKDRCRNSDWRPEIHDNDGLALWTGGGERIWRPLNAPPHVMTNSFFDNNPRGFGLLQRDRDFENYQDDGAYYDRRPSLWVEPIGQWGEGVVMLVEIHTNDEIHDNIVAFWMPKEPTKPGSEYQFAYRLHWTAEEPFPPFPAARVFTTRIGREGLAGQETERNSVGRKFVIDYQGGDLANIAQRYDLEAVVSSSRGEVTDRHVLKVLGTDRWRVSFDLRVSGQEAVDLRCYIRLGDKTLTETWLYQFHPSQGCS